MKGLSKRQFQSVNAPTALNERERPEKWLPERSRYMAVRERDVDDEDTADCLVMIVRRALILLGYCCHPQGPADFTCICDRWVAISLIYAHGSLQKQCLQLHGRELGEKSRL